jgi:quercetin dioxygenase-like cupin family protein
MAIRFNECSIEASTFGNGGTRQELLTRARIPGTNILLDRIAITAGGTVTMDIASDELAWFQMLSGTATLRVDGHDDELSDGHVALLPSGSSASMTTTAGAAFLFARVPAANRFDAAFATASPKLRTVDWRREPVLDSQHDARKRIYLVTPKLFGTKVLKGEMIIYPKGTMAANHHHEGAEHFMYILRGRGTAWANEQPFPVKAGDVVYYPELERHYLKADDDAELVFSEFFVPGEYRTIWVNENEVCTWLPTGRDIRGQAPSREIGAHSSAEVASPADV